MSWEALRLMTYNIHHGRGLDGQVNIQRIAQVILEAQAGIVALQEVDRGVERSHRIDMMARLSDLTGMGYAFGKNLDYQRGDYGNGVLTRFPILHEQNLHYRMTWPDEQRGLLYLVLDINGKEVVLMNTHVDFRSDDTERVSNVEEICTIAQRYTPRPVIVCGDFNDLPESRTITRMTEDFFDVWELVGVGAGATCPTPNPTRRIDYIFISKPVQPHAHPLLKPTFACVVASDASDHLSVMAEFQWGAVATLKRF